jgi:hypothetical protein
MVPEELEYRFLGRSLMLVDTRTDLIVDMLPDVLPAVQHYLRLESGHIREARLA